MASGSDCESDAELMAVSSREQNLYSGDPYSASQAPRDRGRVVYVCMVMAGAGFLFPWSSYVTAIDYFFFLYWEDFHQVSFSSFLSDRALMANPSPYPIQVSVVIPMTYLVSTWLFTGLNITIVNAIPLHARIGLGYLLFLISLLVVPLLDLLVHACILSLHLAFYLTILSVAVVGIGSGGQCACQCYVCTRVCVYIASVLPL